MQLEKFTEELEKYQQAFPEVIAEKAYQVAIKSPFVGQNWLRYPELIDFFAEKPNVSLGEIWQHYIQGQAIEAMDEGVFMQKLRQLRRHYMMQLTWCELTQLITWDQTIYYLSLFADFCIEKAKDYSYTQLYQQYGNPIGKSKQKAQWIVLGMGKLGGYELNFSSDIDLICLYSETGMTDGRKSIENDRFFQLLTQRVVKLLQEPTVDGFVFRVDLRLRPWGEGGPVVLSLEALENYYQAHGREWERYAAIKARVIIGDKKSVYAVLNPFIYRKYFDFNAFASMREIKAMIDREAMRKGAENNIKIGPGGIREIEFITQIFQLIRGGREPVLQSQSLLYILPKLAERNHLPKEVTAQLYQAYGFLRACENRIQMMYDQQTHNIPTKDQDKLRLAYAMGFDNYASFEKILNQHRDFVSNQFHQVFSESKSKEHTELKALWQEEYDENTVYEILTNFGFKEAKSVWEFLKSYKHSSAYRNVTQNTIEKLDKLILLLLEKLGSLENASETLQRVFKIISAIVQRSTYIALLLERPVALDQLIKLCSASPWITEQLAKNPIILDELLNPASLYNPLDKQALYQALQELHETFHSDTEQYMERLRIFKHIQVLRIAAADIADIIPLMKVSDYLTALAEVLTEQVFKIAWDYVKSRYGKPDCDPERQFAIIAYGKLGGIELAYGSDLDLVFIHDCQGSKLTENHKTDNTTFLTRLVQRMVHIFITIMPSGTLYEVDTRLRPDGEAGLLVSSFQAYDKYLHESAWMWEKQALVRARIIMATGTSLTEDFSQLRKAILQNAGDKKTIAEEVSTMREKQFNELGSKTEDIFHLKYDRGGIADIEFMVQYSVLAFSQQYPKLLTYTDNINILEVLATTAILTTEEAAQIIAIYKAYREKVHRLNLQQQSTKVSGDLYLKEREVIKNIWSKLLN